MMENSNTADINREGAAGKNLFGKNLDIVTSLGARGCLDAEAEGDILYVIGVDRTGVIDPVNFKTSYKTGCLYIVDISVPSIPRITGKLSGLGNTRQIEVKDKIAYVASREDGLFIIDVSDPSSPRLMTHYDTVEFATGIDICGDFAYVSCRVYGVEIIDIAEPGTPLHISTIRMGEAQSVDVRDGVLYAGVWGQQNLTVCDVSDPHNPRITAVMPVDGRADGVFVKGDCCYVATGHHARGMARNDESDAAYGNGNGLEIFNIEDPLNPVFISRIKINRFYKLGNDMWDVMVYGKYAFLSHTYNGVFVIDVSDPRKPFFAAHAELPPFEGPDKNDKRNPVGGIALIEDYIYAAGIYSDLYVIKAEGLAGRVSEKGCGEGCCGKGCCGKSPEPVMAQDRGTLPENSAVSGKVISQLYSHENMPAIPLHNSSIPEFKVYVPSSGRPVQVRAAAIHNGIAYAACGSDGIHAIDLNGGRQPRLIKKTATQGIAMDIKIVNGFAYVAEGNAGLSIWKVTGESGNETGETGDGSVSCLRSVPCLLNNPTNGKTQNRPLSRCGTYDAFGNTVGNVIAEEKCKYVMLQIGSRWFHVVDVSDPYAPVLVLSDCPDKGLIYGRQIGNGLLKGRYASCFWHAAGIFWYDITGSEKPCFSGFSQQQRVSQSNNIAFKGDDAILTIRKGYSILDYRYKGVLEDLPLYTVRGFDLTGKPSISGDGKMMFISNRITGTVTFLDISDIRAPRVISCFDAGGNPDVISVEGNIALLPSGYAGLLIFNL